MSEIVETQTSPSPETTPQQEESPTPSSPKPKLRKNSTSSYTVYFDKVAPVAQTSTANLTAPPPAPPPPPPYFFDKIERLSFLQKLNVVRYYYEDFIFLVPEQFVVVNNPLLEEPENEEELIGLVQEARRRNRNRLLKKVISSPGDSPVNTDDESPTLPSQMYITRRNPLYNPYESTPSTPEESSTTTTRHRRAHSSTIAGKKKERSVKTNSQEIDMSQRKQTGNNEIFGNATTAVEIDDTPPPATKPRGRSGGFIPRQPTQEPTTPVSKETGRPLSFTYYAECHQTKSLNCLFTKKKLKQFAGFELPDIPELIVVEEKPAEDEMQIVIPSIRSATLDKLIEKLTSHRDYDNSLPHHFLLTYRSFLPSTELFDKLVNRYNTPPDNPLLHHLQAEYLESHKRWQKEYVKKIQEEEEAKKKKKQQKPEASTAEPAEGSEVQPSAADTTISAETIPQNPYAELAEETPIEFNLTETEFQEFYSKKLSQIRLRVCQVLLKWVDEYFHDFRDDPALRKKFLDFVDVIHNTNLKGTASQLKKAFNKHMERKQSVVTKVEPRKVQKQEMDLKQLLNQSFSSITQLKLKSDKLVNRRTVESQRTLPLYLFRSGDLAQQLTLIAFEMFRNLRPKEFLNQNWMKEDKQFRAPNITAIIQRSNEVGCWVASEVLNQKDQKERVYVIKKFVKVCQKLEKLRNFNTLLDVISGLNSNPIHRLKKTWAAVSPETLEAKQKLEVLINPKKSYANMRQAIRNIETMTTGSPPCIPTINMFLTDIMFIEDGNPNLSKNGLINFTKRRLLAEVIRDIRMYQHQAYELTDLPEIRSRLENLPQNDMDKLYEISLELEPRT